MRFLSGASLLFLLLRQAAAGDADREPQLLSYNKGDKIAVECLNRNIETGEHIQDPKTGKLQYVPFATCNETGSPLQLRFLEDEASGLNCTIPAVSDEQYHLFEFYVHHDSPLSCRVRARPTTGEDSQLVPDTDGTAVEEWVPLSIALAGKLESSHLHISTILNLPIHLSAPGTIDSAAAYSVSTAASATRIVIGDPLPLRFRVRWYAGAELPRTAITGQGAGHTMLYCVLSALVGAVGCYAWVVGVDVPRRLRRATVGMRGRDGGGANGGIIGAAAEKGRGYGGYGLPGNGNGHSVGALGGYGYGGKRKD